jgi:thiol-disulfide isomerase/thioredoxin
MLGSEVLMNTRIWRASAVAAGLVAGLTAGACTRGGEPPAGAGDVAVDSGDKVTVQLLKTRETVPAFSVTTMDGKTISSADWRGKVVLVNFWATWCGPCRAEIPDLVKLQDKYRDQLVIVGISEDDGPTAVDLVKKFADEHHINYTLAMTSDKLQETFPGVVALPTTFLLDREGRIAQKHVGLLHARETEGATRVLAGLEFNGTVEEVDDPGKLTVENAAQVKEIPGLDLAAVPEGRRVELIQALNEEKCTCGCDLSVAKCRIDDPACDVSLPVAKTIAARYAQ